MLYEVHNYVEKNVLSLGGARKKWAFILLQSKVETTFHKYFKFVSLVKNLYIFYKYVFCSTYRYILLSVYTLW